MMKRENIFVVNDKLDINLIKPELAETMAIVESMLTLTRDELCETIVCSHQLWFVQALISQLQTTMRLYRSIHSISNAEDGKKSVFSLNKTIGKNVLQDELASSIHQLHSLCYLAAYKILDELDSHMVNSLTVVNKHMQRAVFLIDVLDMNTFKQQAI